MKLLGGILLKVTKTSEFIQLIEQTRVSKDFTKQIDVLFVPHCHSLWVSYVSVQHVSNRNTVVCFGLLQCRQDKQEKCIQCQCSNVSEKVET